ncbi:MULTISPECIES: RHS repeat-associated core domain-containing protein [Chryseobacterium]|uniref:RHS repeat-associated protein n=1 Tax=Chryseobacterium geocarposphaerae TaxID=1416776 RepID=A0ABU1LFE6_9FLAO|nr:MULTISPECIES: RHS repeat-associated core domain-containing protein [Chryseobacterium]MDR6405320.1 RHS repeat-associated protein [Chryseobacterium geocarposphaerae]MDR6697479.1 RHS repeat-associated protein [Chryseobacterium ginsenosidimutans]
MKIKLFSSFILSLCSVLGLSQTILYQAESTTRTVQDPQTIVIEKGFVAAGNISNPFVAKIGPATENPGGGPTDSNAGTNNPTGTSAPVGQSFHDTKGNIDVNGAGQLQFTLPITLPPGVKNVVPQISLIYTSGSGNGIAGYGWNISGITSISRVGKNIEKDGETRGVQMDYSDYYSFNGQRLILKSGEYGKDGAQYVTEKYSNIKIKSVGTYPVNGQDAGPAHFEVTFEDGSQAWYGAYVAGSRINPNITTPLEYNIVKWKDAQGNYISYGYQAAGNNGGFRTVTNIVRIESIGWGGNETLNKPHFNFIEFLYADRLLPEQSHAKGITFIQDKLLSSIKITSNAQPYRNYIIDYKKDTNGTDYQFVNKITEYNGANEAANPVVFDYEKSNLGGWKSTNYDYTEDHKVLGDFDGDGKVDMFKYSNSVNYCKTYNTQHPLNPTANENEISYTDYGDSKCVEWVNEPAGFYLFKNIFDENKPEKILVASDITKESLDNALSIVVKDNNNIVNSKQSIVIIKKNKVGTTQAYDMDFRVYTFSDNNTLDFQFNKAIPYSQYAIDPIYSFNNNTTIESQTKEVDINGDGLSELIIGLKDRICFSGPIDPEIDPDGILPGGGTTCNTTYRYLRISLDKNVSNDNSFASFTLSPISTPALNNYLVGDFDGDSQTDFLKLNSGLPILVKLKDDGQNVIVEESGMSNIPITGVWASSVLGDYNGDGKTDIMIPTGYNSSDWRMYSSTGIGFVEKYYSNFCYFQSSQNDPNNYVPWFSYQRTYVAQDMNRDGKSDFIEFFSLVQIAQNGNAQSRFLVNLYENKGYKSSSTKIEFQKKKLINYTNANTPVNFPLIENYRGYPYWYNTNNTYYRTSMEQLTWSTVAEHYTPIFGNFRVNMADENILVFQKSKLFKFNYYDVSREARIKTITQANITTEIEYKELDPSIDANFYKSVKKEQYPYMELNKVYQTAAVYQLRNSGRKQDFRYRGFVSHFEGKGVIGFRQTARSSWYADGFENTKIWSGIETDPLNDAATVKEWSIRTNDETKIFPADLSETNTQLLSLKSTIYQTDKLLNGQIVTTIANADKPKIVTATVPKSTRIKDFLTNTVTTSTISYGDHYLPSQSVSNVNDNYAVNISTFEYLHNINGTGPDYYVGRPKNKTDVVQAYGDTKTTREELVYENNLLKTLKTWNRDNTGFLQETYNYDGFGNIILETVSNSIDTQMQTNQSEYDPKGRFVIKKTDNLGLITNITHNDDGQVLTQTDPLGNTLVNTYDPWGKILKSKSNLDGTTTYEYIKDSYGNTVLVQYDADGNISKKFINKLGLEYRTTTKGFGQGQFISKDIEYDILGRKYRESEPYFEGQAASSWNVIEYDDTVFPTKIKTTIFNGKQLESSSLGLVTTIKELNGYSRITTKTADALGNIVSSTDKGGTIIFSYNAAGEQIKAQYAENSVTTKYDAWGRKSELNDPSNGTYKYEYDGLGQPKKVISPKGTKEFTYNTLGQLIAKKEISSADAGQATNKVINFTYDDKGRIISKSGTSKGKTYSSSVVYDQQGRNLSSSENSNGRYFIQKGITYDDKGRIISYEKQLYSSGIMTKVTIENVYNPWNGELYQVKDKTSGKVLWQLQETNAKGQILSAKLGQATVTNTYDNNGFLSNMNHSSALKPSILQISYSFDAIKNELKSRTTGGDLNIIESFDYDDNNRLINWTDPITGIKPSANRNVYDIKGRITANDDVGTIKFENTSKIYQPTGMTLNAAGTQNYNNDLIQTIVYNENNDPVFIDGMKGDVAFQYGLTSMRQRVTYGGNFAADAEGKFTKFYSEDGSFEVIVNHNAGTEKHILYIGGTPYESNIVYIKNYAESVGSYKFLHKDYLGSVLAITNEEGGKLEQRHFDAWGNMTHFMRGTKPPMTGIAAINNFIATGGLTLERGYTGHEHFPEVGIIHMNGRLYDPLLRRFLNADENIQDPYNTQNYNKYGYVLNNPLMFNDPSGEAFQFLIAAGVGIFWATVLTGAIISSAIATFLYLSKAYLTRNFSVSGFFKAVTIGSITGAVSAGLGQVFSAGTFLAYVGNGALSGLGSAAVQSLANGTNFLQGITKGAVIGAAMGAISYGIMKLSTKPSGETLDVLDDTEGVAENPVTVDAREVKKVMTKDFKGKSPANGSIKVLRKPEDLPKYLKDKGYKFDGKTLLNDDGEKVLATTTPFYGNKYMRYVFAPNSFKSPEVLSLTTGHEMLHATFFAYGIRSEELSQGHSWNYGAKTVGSHHAIIAEWEKGYVDLKGWGNLGLPMEPRFDLTKLRTYNPGFNAKFDKMMQIMKKFLK